MEEAAVADEPVGDEQAAAHRDAAIAANNGAWSLLGKVEAGEELTAAQRHDVLSHAFASAYHWARAKDATVANQVRAHWLISRSAAVAGHGELALENAKASLALCETNQDDVADFDHAYAREAAARSLACLGRTDEAAAEIALAKAVEVADPEDRALVVSDFASPPWFGLEG